jgi:hypothetical protein
MNAPGRRIGGRSKGLAIRSVLRSLKLRHAHIARQMGFTVAQTGATMPGQGSIIASAARRSPGFIFRNNARAFLMSRSEPLSAAAFRATVVGWSAPQMKARAFASRPIASRSIDISDIQNSLCDKVFTASDLARDRSPRPPLDHAARRPVHYNIDKRMSHGDGRMVAAVLAPCLREVAAQEPEISLRKPCFSRSESSYREAHSDHVHNALRPPPQP